MKYLLDTNIVIYFLGEFALSNNALGRIDSICRDEQNISIITKLELLGFNFTSTTNEIETIEFVTKSIIYPIVPDVEIQTIKIRKSIKIKLADAIIAATAKAHDLTLLTRNIGDFDHVEGLKIENPFEW